MAVVSESRFSFVLSAGAGGRVSEELQSPTTTARVTQGRWGGGAGGRMVGGEGGDPQRRWWKMTVPLLLFYFFFFFFFLLLVFILVAVRRVGDCSVTLQPQV